MFHHFSCFECVRNSLRHFFCWWFKNSSLETKFAQTVWRWNIYSSLFLFYCPGCTFVLGCWKTNKVIEWIMCVVHDSNLACNSTNMKQHTGIQIKNAFNTVFIFPNIHHVNDYMRNELIFITFVFLSATRKVSM